MNVEFVSATQPAIVGVDTAEALIAYCARVSNPGNQMNTETAPRLLRYLIRNKHWSPFEMVSMCVSIETSRAIAAQILRHRSFSFQEFSQRYAEVVDIEPVELRMAGSTDRQGSIDETAPRTCQIAMHGAIATAKMAYKELIEAGVAKESARMVLPLCTQTKLYMTGTIRSWIHYLQQRTDLHTQKEHRDIADKILQILSDQFPTVYEAAF